MHGIFLIAQVVVHSSLAICLRFQLIGCVPLDSENHVASFVAEVGIEVCGTVVFEFDDDIGSALSGMGLCHGIVVCQQVQSFGL